MNLVELIGDVDEQHQLHVDLPPDMQPGPVKITVRPATEEEDGDWKALINHSWAKDWGDTQEDIYTLEDGNEKEQKYVIPQDRFDNPDYIEHRVRALPISSQGALRTALRYLYLSNGPVNLPRKRLKIAESFLDPAELMLVRWLYTRTNGKERRNYGANALIQARFAHYRCERCGFPDVRTIELDHVRGIVGKTFSCLCANCHTTKSRKEDWTGK